MFLTFVEICTIHSRILATYDRTMTPFVVPEEWTLLTGDTCQQMFSVFVKSINGNRLAMKIYFGKHVMEIVPRNIVPAAVVVTVNGKVIDNHKSGVLVPEKDIDSYDMR